ncbi:hypothetical protein ACFQY0_13855 [Haloferula chungangensis]|uniref:Uncharacterized protein n=1 Tax=Haloferula chungangensis TaxID=1048331 RepID=A0ABW2L951_9BACT
MPERTHSARSSIFMLFLGLPGLVLWLGGLWFCYTAVLIQVLDLSDFDYTAAQKKRLYIAYVTALFAPFIGYTMIVMASLLCGFDHYRLPPKQAVALACFDAGQQFLFLLALCQLIMMGPWGVYDFMSPGILISSGLLILAYLLLRRFAKRKHHEWLNPP